MIPESDDMPKWYEIAESYDVEMFWRVRRESPVAYAARLARMLAALAAASPVFALHSHDTRRGGRADLCDAA